MVSHNLLVSILVPVYNAATYLPKCILSILQQSYDNLQIVLWDDGSMDESLAICKEYALRDNRIEVYSVDNQGVASARNNLLTKAKGDCVLFVDSDDWIEHNMVEYMLNLMQRDNSEIVLCNKFINDQERLFESLHEKSVFQIDAIKDFLKHNYFTGSLWNKLIKRSLISRIQFNPEISYGEDALFVWQLLQKVTKVSISNKQLYHYRITSTSLSHNYSGHQFTANIVWKLILIDVISSYQDLVELAKAQQCNQMTVILYDAARHGYKYDRNVEESCQIISCNKKYLYRLGASYRKYIFACVISRYYRIIEMLFSSFKKCK